MIFIIYNWYIIYNACLNAGKLLGTLMTGMDGHQHSPMIDLMPYLWCANRFNQLKDSISSLSYQIDYGHVHQRSPISCNALAVLILLELNIIRQLISFWFLRSPNYRVSCETLHQKVLYCTCTGYNVYSIQYGL